jgi:hypothetical protein
MADDSGYGVRLRSGAMCGIPIGKKLAAGLFCIIAGAI